ncbi:MAG: EAL domain-containing protein [Gammaproteobacteria bacterium]|nr:EAL domain-containing protein [Gammaproteobacteria bacterium]
MSAQQLPQHAPVRLLIADTSENLAHELDSMLRDAGIPTRLNVIDDLEQATDVLANAEADLYLLNGGEAELTQVVAQVKNHTPAIPVILLTDPNNPVAIEKGLELGATDVVHNDQPKHLLMVVQRELDHVCQRVDYTQMRKALQAAEQRCQLLLQSSKAAIAYVHEGMHIYANEAYFKLFGFEESDDLLGLPLIDLVTPESTAELKEKMKAFRHDADEQCLDFEGQSTEGDAVSGTITLAAAEYEGETCIQVTIRSQEIPVITDVVDANPMPPTNADSETPTPACNGAALDLPIFLQAVDNEAEDQYLFIAGIDVYEDLRKHHGLQGTFEIAHEIEQSLRSSLDGYAFVKLDTSHFAFVLATESMDTAIDRADGLRQGVEEFLLEIDAKTVRPTISIVGHALGPDNDASCALDSAFRKLTEVQDGDRNKVVIAGDDVVEPESDEATRLVQLINHAIDKNRFQLLFQPIISLRGDSDEHYEVFLRMLDKDEAMRPAQFLQTAIENNVAGKIDRWVILQSIKILSAHRAKGHDTRLTINVTCNSVSDPEFIQWLGVAIKAARLPSDAVIFQITERDASTYIRQTREFVEGLKGMHVRASLSHFGLSEDSFETLRHIPVEFVKLDGSHIEELKDDPELREAITATIRQLQSNGKLTIVPMVESAHVLSALWQAGANYIQGHYLQEPTSEMDYDFSTEDG